VRLEWKPGAGQEGVQTDWAILAQEDLFSDSDDRGREVRRIAAADPRTADIRFADASRGPGGAPRRMRLTVIPVDSAGKRGRPSKPVCVVDCFGIGRVEAGADGSVVLADLHDQGGEILVRRAGGDFLPVRIHPEGLAEANFLGVPADIAVDRGGRIAACFPGQKNVALFGPDLRGVARLLSEGGWSDPRGVAFDRDGNIYVLDAAKGHVVVFHPNGSLAATWPGLENRLKTPVSLSSDGMSRFYVADAGSRAVLVLRHEKKRLVVERTIACPEASPQAACVDERGRIFVAGAEGGILVFGSSPKELARVRELDGRNFGTVRGVAVRDGVLHASTDEGVLHVSIEKLFK
jgi:hypothetical protein